MWYGDSSFISDSDSDSLSSGQTDAQDFFGASDFPALCFAKSLAKSRERGRAISSSCNSSSKLLESRRPLNLSQLSGTASDGENSVVAIVGQGTEPR